MKRLLEVFWANVPLLKLYIARWRYIGGRDSHGKFLEELRDFCEREEIKWPDRLEKRLGYYLTGVDWFLYWMVGLLGKKLEQNERRRGWLMAVMFALGDEVSEAKAQKQADIKTAVLTKEKALQNPQERLIGYVYQQLLADHPDLTTFEKYLQLGLQAQDDSLLQKGQTLPPSRLRKITFDKCGYAFLLLRSSLNQPIGEHEIDAIYTLGGLIQLINDTFDVYEDCRDGIHTLPNTARNIHPFRKELERVALHTLHAFQASPKRRKRFALQLAPILAATRVCLWQFEALQARSGGEFKPEAYSREELICDMEKPANLWRAIKFIKFAT